MQETTWAWVPELCSEKAAQPGAESGGGAELGGGAESGGGASDPGLKELGQSDLRETQPKAALASCHPSAQLGTPRARGTAGLRRTWACRAGRTSPCANPKSHRINKKPSTSPGQVCGQTGVDWKRVLKETVRPPGLEETAPHHRWPSRPQMWHGGTGPVVHSLHPQTCHVESSGPWQGA